MKNISTDMGLISDKLLGYLRDQLKDPNIEYCQPLKQLQGGYETSIYRFQLKGVGGDFSQRLVLRLYPQFYGTQNAVWESTVQNALARDLLKRLSREQRLAVVGFAFNQALARIADQAD